MPTGKSPSSALQKAVWTALTTDPEILAIVGARVYDVPPDGAAFPYLSLGPTSIITERRTGFGSRTEVIQVDAWTRDSMATQPCKDLCDAVVARMDQGALDLDHPFALARMDLVLYRVMRDPDPLTAHGVMQFETEVTGG